MSDFLGAGLPRGESPREAARTSAMPSPADGQRRGSPVPSLASRRALDWFVFFLADVQTGFGAFVSVYLTAQKWTQTDIGLVLTVGAFVGLVGQIPGGAIVDAARSAALGGGCGRRGCRDQRVRARRVAGLCGRLRLSDFAGGRELRAGPGDRGDQPRPCRPQTDQRAPGPQRGFRFSRLRPRRGGHGRLRILHFGPRGLYPRGEHDRAGAVRPLPHTNPRNRSDEGSWRRRETRA